jgi:hypothetical protein
MHSPEGIRKARKIVRQVLALAAERVRREENWARQYPVEWAEWQRLQPLLAPLVVFGGDMRFDFDDFLMEVGRAPLSANRVVCKFPARPYQQGNLMWAAETPEPPRSPYLNVKEAAAYLGVAVRTVYNNRRHIPALPGFRKLMFDPKVLDGVRASVRFMSKRRSSPR